MSVWGKVIGGAAGFALGGPLGAMMGVMAGSGYDKTRKKSSARQGIPNQQKQYQEISSQEKQHIFALSVITLTAKLAKADGVVTQDEIEVFKEKFKNHNITIVNEDDILSFKDFKNIFLNLSKALKYQKEFENRLEWYYQQMLKITFVIDFIDMNNFYNRKIVEKKCGKQNSGIFRNGFCR